MKLKLIFFSLFTLSLVAGCTSRIGDELEGNVKLSLLGDYEVVAHTKASDFTEEELAAFQIEINDPDGVTVKSGSYSEFREPFQLASLADYSLYAQNQNEESALSSNDGRGSLRVMGSTTFTVNPGDITHVKCTCKVVNARVSVGYDETFTTMFQEATVTVNENSDAERCFTYDINSTHTSSDTYAYFNIDSDPKVQINVSAKLQSGEDKTYTKSIDIAAGQWSKITLASNFVGGQADLDIKVDTDPVIKEQDLVMDPLEILTLTLPEQSVDNIYARYFIPTLLRPSDVSNVQNSEEVYNSLVYEISEDGETWIQATVVDGVTVFNGLEPGTRYGFRANCPNIITSEIYWFTTEQAVQLPNNSFETSSSSKVYDAWMSETGIFTYSFSGWNTNNNTSLPSGVGGNKTFWTHDAVVKSVGNASDGAKAVELSTRAFDSETPKGIQVGTIYNSTVYDRVDKVINGRLYLDKSGCVSRPSSVSFDYKYDVYEGDNFKIKVTLFNASNVQVASAEFSSSEAKSSYEKVTLTFDYEEGAYSTKSVAYISVDIVSGHATDKSKTRRLDGGYDASPNPDDIVVGSVLTIDNIILNYEEYK